MYTVYKITNKINNKSYIGSSTRVEKRWQEHLNDSKNSNSRRYNYPLYKAFRKYGIENFEFSVLKDDFSSIKDMQLYENNMIIAYDSYNNGYNQTYQTIPSELGKENLQKYLKSIQQHCAKIDKNNNILEIYSSYHDASRKNGYDNLMASTIRRVCKGELSSLNGIYFRDLDINNNLIIYPIKFSHGKKSIVGINISNPLEEIYFDSISEAANELNIERKSIGLCLKGSIRYTTVKGYIWRELDINGDIIENNISIDELIKKYNLMNPLINGERHNIKKWCEIYHISTTSYYKRIKKGLSPYEALTKPKKGGEN